MRRKLLRRVRWFGLRADRGGIASETSCKLRRVQRGESPDDFKPIPQVGRGVEEIRIWDEAGTFRVIYTVRTTDAVYVLHAFEKKSQTIAKPDVELARARFAQLMRGR